MNKFSLSTLLKFKSRIWISYFVQNLGFNLKWHLKSILLANTGGNNWHATVTSEQPGKLQACHKNLCSLHMSFDQIFRHSRHISVYVSCKMVKQVPHYIVIFGQTWINVFSFYEITRYFVPCLPVNPQTFLFGYSTNPSSQVIYGIKLDASLIAAPGYLTVAGMKLQKISFSVFTGEGELLLLNSRLNVGSTYLLMILTACTDKPEVRVAIQTTSFVSHKPDAFLHPSKMCLCMTLPRTPVFKYVVKVLRYTKILCTSKNALSLLLEPDTIGVGVLHVKDKWSRRDQQSYSLNNLMLIIWT